MFPRLTKCFLRGLLVLGPIVLTVYLTVLLFRAIDGWINVEALLNRRIPGAGVVVTLTVIMVAGMLASSVLTRWMFHLADSVISRLPVIKTLYGSLRDFFGAFVGEQRKFDNPVRVRLSDANDVQLVGFLTRSDLSLLGLPNHVSVYVSMAYNVGGSVLIVPKDRIEPLPVDGASAMTFALSGGVTGASADDVTRAAEKRRDA